ncbi:zeta toxin family protein [Tumebacillus permanentifrigoris]|uniref:Putative ABC-type ATPase n=1 Tax=Tumebacillus permanentifrigoris TaxID=378543 RepID=A0A316D4K4_9BACL|nr:zeta toxin family protein [Tumebacillus permanentifrigoris]PWK07040.1 putative ABC-type ATPase [Tumebacillus permanentifrigoris]
MSKNKHKPKLFVFAGANGSGKSSTRESLSLGMGFGVIIDTDAIARTINPEVPESANVEAGREAIKVARDCISSGVSFCIENHIRSAKAAGYELHMFFLGVDRVEVNIERVEVRVKNGGHDIPEETIRKRYVTSIENLIKILNLIDELVIIDNSESSRSILVAKQGKVVSVDEVLPDWAQTIRTYLV